MVLTSRRRRARSVTPSPPCGGLDAALVDALHVGALVLDANDTVITCNPAGRRMGLVRGERLTLNELRALAAEAREHAAPQQTEVRLLHGWLPAEPLAVQARAVPVGEAGHVALLVEDVTEARRVEAMRRDFVANVSHELKTPVGALSLLSEALQAGHDDPEAVQRFAARIQHEAARLARLVAELMELSRLETAGPLREPVPVAVHEVLAEAVDRTRAAAAAREVSIDVEAEADVWVPGEREQLVTAVVNLLDNAVAYSNERTEVRIVARRAASTADRVEIDVTDHGIGIDEADLERVFERFYRADPARSRSTGGTGLGLSIVKHVATNHGGSVTVRSRPGHGSTFTLVLPAVTRPVT